MISSWSYAKNLSLYYGIFVAVILVIVLAIYVSVNTSISIRPAPLIQYNTYECLAGSAENNPTFKMFVLSESQAVQYSNSLCNNSAIQQHYSKVQAIWQRRDIDILRVIFDQPFDLMIAKPELVERPEIDLYETYIPIAEYLDYTSRFISLESPPQLTEEYLREKKLGLLYNPTSISGHKVPRETIKNSGLNENDINIQYYNSHFDLYRALIDGEVNIIGTGLVLSSSQLGARTHYTLPIKGGLKSPRWYLHPSLSHTELHCQIFSILKTKSEESEIIFEQSLMPIETCSH